MLKLAITALLLAAPAFAEQNLSGQPGGTASGFANIGAGGGMPAVLTRDQLPPPRPANLGNGGSGDCDCVNGYVVVSQREARAAAMAHYRRATKAGFAHATVTSINSFGAKGFRVTVGPKKRTFDYIVVPLRNDSTSGMTQDPSDGTWHVTGP
jgi:hypothetical protein